MSIVAGLTHRPFVPLRLSWRELALPGGHLAPFSRFFRHEVVHSHQIVGRQGKEEEGVDRFLASDLHLSQAPRQLDPPEDLLDSLSKPDTDGHCCPKRFQAQ